MLRYTTVVIQIMVFVILSNSQARALSTSLCSNLFSKDLLNVYEGPSEKTKFDLEKQFKTTVQGSKVRMGSINLSKHFKHYSSYLTVHFQNEKTQNIFVFGRPYSFNGERVIDFAFDIDSTVLSRVAISTLFNAALSAEFKRDIRENYGLILMPIDSVGSRQNSFQVFQFSKWMNSEQTKVEVVSTFGEKKIISLEAYFDGILLADQDLISDIETFYLAGGRGKLFYMDAEVNPSFHGLSILLSSWPKDIISSWPLFRESDNKPLVQDLLSRKIPVVYTLGYRDYRGAADHGGPSGRYLKNRVGVRKDADDVLLVTNNTKPDTLIHERQHLDDYASNLKNDLINRLSDITRSYEKNVPKKFRVKDYEQFFRSALHIILEQRAYHTQASYIFEKSETGEIDSLKAKAKIQELNEDYNKYYVQKYNVMAKQLKDSNSVNVVDEVKKLISNTIIPSKFILTHFDEE